jgi:hypothetical protein
MLYQYPSLMKPCINIRSNKVQHVGSTSCNNKLMNATYWVHLNSFGNAHRWIRFEWLKRTVRPRNSVKTLKIINGTIFLGIYVTTQCVTHKTDIHFVDVKNTFMLINLQHVICSNDKNVFLIHFDLQILFTMHRIVCKEGNFKIT